VIVARGLGRGLGAALVTAGLGLGIALTLPPSLLPLGNSGDSGSSYGRGQISNEEWQRRKKKLEVLPELVVAATAVDVAQTVRSAKRKRRRAEEQLLLILG
jgi:hypothetical protein